MRSRPRRRLALITSVALFGAVVASFAPWWTSEPPAPKPCRLVSPWGDDVPAACVAEWYGSADGVRQLERWACDPAHLRTPGIVARLEAEHDCDGDSWHRAQIEGAFRLAGYPQAGWLFSEQVRPEVPCGPPPPEPWLGWECSPVPEDAPWWHVEACAARWADDPLGPHAADLLGVLEAHPVWLIDERFGNAALALAACGDADERARAGRLVARVLPDEVAAATPVPCTPQRE